MSVYMSVYESESVIESVSMCAYMYRNVVM